MKISLSLYRPVPAGPGRTRYCTVLYCTVLYCTCGAGEDEALDGLVLGAGGGGAGHGHAAHIRHSPALSLQQQCNLLTVRNGDYLFFCKYIQRIKFKLSLYLSPTNKCCQGTR